MNHVILPFYLLMPAV